MSDFYNNQHLGKTKFEIWFGQVMGDWQGNENEEVHEPEDIPGWGKRYKVAIFGHEPFKTVEGVSNPELPMAEVLLPTTAGSGLAGSNSTPQIQQNSFVVGFFKDGIEHREPVIFGVIPNVPQTILNNYDINDGQTRYNAGSGFEPEDQIIDARILATQGRTNENSVDPNIHFLSRPKQLQDGVVMDYIPKPYLCDEPQGELKGIQMAIQNGLNALNQVKAAGQSFQNSASQPTSQVQNIINTISSSISNLMKEMVQRMRNLTLNLFMESVQPIANETPPNLRQELRIATEKETDIINCLFNSKIAGLFDFIMGLIKDLILGGVAAVECSVGKLVGSVLTDILNSVMNTIDGALSTIGNTIGGITNFAGNILSALDFIFDLFQLFTCEVPLKCPDIDEWSLWYGSSKKTPSISMNMSGLATFNTNKNTATNAQNTCDTGPKPCVPPVLQIFNGPGNGFNANSVISNSGQLLAFDILNSGKGYSSSPILSFTDNCGIGNGAVILPVVNRPRSLNNIYRNSPNIRNQFGGNLNRPEGTFPGLADDFFDEQETSGEIIDIIVVDGGVGYNPIPDGSTGAGGQVFSKPGDTVILQNNNNYISVPPDTNVEVNPGDVIFTTPTPIVVENSDIFTTPEAVIPPEIDDTTYEVILEIKNIYIETPGINYSEDDTIIIEPNLGAELTPVFDDNGRVISVNVLSSGTGFTDRPKIYIQSNTGFNAKLIPVFRVNRINEDRQELKNIPKLTVIDCFSKYYKK